MGNDSTAINREMRLITHKPRRVQFRKHPGPWLVATAEATQLYREVELPYPGLDQFAQADDDRRLHKNIVLRIVSVTSHYPLLIKAENNCDIWDMVEQSRCDLGLVDVSSRMMDKNAVRSQNTKAVAPWHKAIV